MGPTFARLRWFIHPRLAFRDAVHLRLMQGIDLAAALRPLMQGSADPPESFGTTGAQGTIRDLVEVTAQVAHHPPRVPLELSRRLAHAADLPGMGVAARLHSQPGREPIVALSQLDPGLCRPPASPGQPAGGGPSRGAGSLPDARCSFPSPWYRRRPGTGCHHRPRRTCARRSSWSLDRPGQQPLHPVLADPLAPPHKRRRVDRRVDRRAVLKERLAGEVLIIRVFHPAGDHRLIGEPVLARRGGEADRGLLRRSLASSAGSNRLRRLG